MDESFYKCIENAKCNRCGSHMDLRKVNNCYTRSQIGILEILCANCISKVTYTSGRCRLCNGTESISYMMICVNCRNGKSGFTHIERMNKIRSYMDLFLMSFGFGYTSIGARSNISLNVIRTKSYPIFIHVSTQLQGELRKAEEIMMCYWHNSFDTDISLFIYLNPDESEVHKQSLLDRMNYMASLIKKCIDDHIPLKDGPNAAYLYYDDTVLGEVKNLAEKIVIPF